MHRTIFLAVMLLFPAAAAAEPPTLLSMRATGLFADYEFELLPQGGPGIVHTPFGLDANVVLPIGLVVEGGGEWLLSLESTGWAAVVRSGWWFGLLGDRSSERNRWSAAVIPMGGVRVGSHPYSATSDGYALNTSSVAVQLATAFEVGRIGPKIGYLVRAFVGGNGRFVNVKTPDGVPWSYARTEPATFAVEAGLSFGFTIPIL